MATVRAPQRVTPAQAPAPARDHLRAVDHPARRRFSVAFLTVTGVAGLFAVLFGLVVFQTMLVQNQQRLDRLDQQVREQQAIYQQQRLQVAELSAPDRIVAEATRLGLVPPPGTTYLTPTESVVAPDPAADSATDTADPAPATTTDDWSQVKPELGSPR